MKFGLREIAFLVLLLAVPVGAWWFVFCPQNEINERMERQTEAKQQNLRAANRAAASIDDLQDEISQISEAMTYFRSKLPSEKEMDKVLQEIWKLADRNRLKCTSFRPMDEDEDLRYTPEGGPYAEQPMEVDLEGNFMGVYAFLQALERQPRITRIRRLEFEVPKKTVTYNLRGGAAAGAPNKGVSPPGYVKVRFVMSVFFERNGSAGRGRS